MQPTEPIFGVGAPLPQPERTFLNTPLDSSWNQPTLHGLQNVDFTCYMNSVIQCLQYVPMWSNYLWNDHADECNLQKKDCYTCILSSTTETMYNRNRAVVRPTTLATKLDLLSESFLEEELNDAHEFFIRLLEKTQANILMHKNADHYEAMTTAVGKIFGGFLRSQISCQECLATNNTYESYFNIGLNVAGVDSMDTALENFFGIDTMDDCKWYNCDDCLKKTRAAKRYTVETLPEVLIFQLNRLDMYGNKLDHHVEFPSILNLEQYMSSDGYQSTYRLYGVINHVEIMTTKNRKIGHYRSYVSHPAIKTFNWHCIDDDETKKTSWSKVKNLSAYLLFYIKRDPQDADEDIEEIIEMFAKAEVSEGNEKKKEKVQKENVQAEFLRQKQNNSKKKNYGNEQKEGEEDGKQKNYPKKNNNRKEKDEEADMPGKQQNFYKKKNKSHKRR